MDQKTYVSRRETLRAKVPEGVILLAGNVEMPRNYAANAFSFRQDSHFLYYIGTSQPGLAAVIGPGGEAALYGPPEDPDDLVWHGPHQVLADHAAAAGVSRAEDIGKLEGDLQKWRSKGLEIHYLLPYHAERTALLASWLGIPAGEVARRASPELARAIVVQRSIKSAEEVAEIEDALEITAKMYAVAMKSTKPGVREHEVAGAMQGVALSFDRAQTFLPIVSIRGEVLHNTSYQNTMQAGDLLLVDAGCESKRYYAADITRTLPVSGHFTPIQRQVYEAVLSGQLAAIESASPKVSNRDLHLIAAKAITRGLRDIGLMKGDVEEAVQEGAHALFFVHGLGHMLGLDVHDMEDLGDAVGYREGEKRSAQFGLSFLRLAKHLEPGFCITVEPGVYFVPALIDRWKAEKKHESFINFAEVEKMKGFGGVRIEDDILITADGCRVLGPKIPKTAAEVEAAMAR